MKGWVSRTEVVCALFQLVETRLPQFFEVNLTLLHKSYIIIAIISSIFAFHPSRPLADDRITIGYQSNPHIRGVIATSDIPAGTILVHTPHNLILSSDTGDRCLDIKNIQHELSKGIGSVWYTYFNFDDSSGSRVPSHWRAVHELQGLPPSGYTHKHLDWYTNTCWREFQEGGNSSSMSEEEKELYWKAADMSLTRSANIGIIPLYDLMNHHNGKINTRLHRDGEGGLIVAALVDIMAGEPIYLTYARGGVESSIDVFNTYGFVEEYPQLWRWSGDELEEGEVASESTKKTASRGHNSNRYIIPISDHFAPNHPLYEILIISPTLAALSPTKQLVKVLGNERRSLEEWSSLMHSHHGVVRSSYVHALRDAAQTLLNGLPTTLEEDTKILRIEKKQLERLLASGSDDVSKKDVIQAIEYRMAFKRALRLAVEVAEKEGIFYVDDDMEGEL